MPPNMNIYKMKIVCTIFYIAATLYYSEACSSRSIPKPRPSPSTTTYLNPSSSSMGVGSTALPNKVSSGIPSSSLDTTFRTQTSTSTTTITTSTTSTTSTTTSTTPRPNITFPTYKCPETYDAWYCLNDATCFSVKIGESIMYNCACATGYTGPRCEYKEIDGSYLPQRPRAILEKASIASGATCALLFMFFIVLTLYMRSEYQAKTFDDDEDLIMNDFHDCCGYNYSIGNDEVITEDNTIHYTYRNELKSCRYCNDKRCCGNRIGLINMNDNNYHRLRHNSNVSCY